MGTVPTLVIEAARRSGRTTRMMQHAVQLDQNGRAVYVCIRDKGQIPALEKIRRNLCPKATGIQYDTPVHLDIDWETLTLRGAHPNCVLLIDHAVIEHTFGRVLQMHRQYDSDGGSKWAWDRGYRATVDGETFP